jgi:hypothetical protein
MQAFVQKVILQLFLDHQGPPVEHYMSKGKTVTSASLCDVLDHLKYAIVSKTLWTGQYWWTMLD